MLKTEFIKDSKNATHLYVNGEKTNVYFFTPKYCEQFPWNGSHAYQKRQAETIKKLIEEGELKPLDSESFDMFDICAGCRVDLSNTIVLSEKVNYEREIFGCSTPYEITDDLKPGLLKAIHEQKSFLTQYCKMLSDDKLLKRTGVYFFKFGYSVCFIE